MAWHHQLIARLLNCFPRVAERWTTKAVRSISTDLPDEPWTPALSDPLAARLLLVTTGGVHTPEQAPFDMTRPIGDASYRWIPREQKSFRITHDYYDHRDADADINCLFPLPLARKLSDVGHIGPLCSAHLSFMGHIEDPLVPSLLTQSIPRMWEELGDPPELAVLSPA